MLRSSCFLEGHEDDDLLAVPASPDPMEKVLYELQHLDSTFPAAVEGEEGSESLLLNISGSPQHPLYPASAATACDSTLSDMPSSTHRTLLASAALRSFKPCRSALKHDNSWSAADAAAEPESVMVPVDGEPATVSPAAAAATVASAPVGLAQVGLAQVQAASQLGRPRQQQPQKARSSKGRGSSRSSKTAVAAEAAASAAAAAAPDSTYPAQLNLNRHKPTSEAAPIGVSGDRAVALYFYLKDASPQSNLRKLVRRLKVLLLAQDAHKAVGTATAERAKLFARGGQHNRKACEEFLEMVLGPNDEGSAPWPTTEELTPMGQLEYLARLLTWLTDSQVTAAQVDSCFVPGYAEWTVDASRVEQLLRVPAASLELPLKKLSAASNGGGGGGDVPAAAPAPAAELLPPQATGTVARPSAAEIAAAAARMRHQKGTKRLSSDNTSSTRSKQQKQTSSSTATGAAAAAAADAAVPYGLTVSPTAAAAAAASGGCMGWDQSAQQQLGLAAGGCPVGSSAAAAAAATATVAAGGHADYGVGGRSAATAAAAGLLKAGTEMRRVQRHQQLQ